MRRSIILALAAAICSLSLPARNADDAYREYIETFAPMAVDQQNAFGIPASITLAQGLLESAAGKSTLAREGNNHFGIKCHRDWQGKTMLRDDDAPDECFRVYSSVAESFDDHSRFLSRKRYEPLFACPVTDYQAWARTLSSCGYATDPNYADRLIAIIERYALYIYDTEAGRQAEETVSFIFDSLSRRHPVRRSRGLYYVVAVPGDTYSSIAGELKMKKKKLMEYNDVSSDREIKPWQEVYLVEKRGSGDDLPEWCTIGEGESMHSVSQRYALKMTVLKALNPDATDSPGTRLRLRH